MAAATKAAGGTVTPTELAVEIWGQSEGFSRSRGARKVREIARDLFPEEAPGKGGRWHLTRVQASAIRRDDRAR